MSPAAGAATVGAEVERAAGALGPAPAVVEEPMATMGLVATMSTAKDPTAAGGASGRGRRALAHPQRKSVSSSRLCHLQT